MIYMADDTTEILLMEGVFCEEDDLAHFQD